MTFGVDNSSSSHSENRNNNFLVLGEGPIYGINGSFGSPEKKFTVSFSKANTKCCLVLHFTMLIIVVYLLMQKKYFSLKPTIEMFIFQLNFVSEVFLSSIRFINTESREVSLNGNV